MKDAQASTDSEDSEDEHLIRPPPNLVALCRDILGRPASMQEVMRAWDMCEGSGEQRIQRTVDLLLQAAASNGEDDELQILPTPPRAGPSKSHAKTGSGPPKSVAKEGHRARSQQPSIRDAVKIDSDSDSDSDVEFVPAQGQSDKGKRRARMPSNPPLPEEGLPRAKKRRMHEAEKQVDRHPESDTIKSDAQRAQVAEIQEPGEAKARVRLFGGKTSRT